MLWSTRGCVHEELGAAPQSCWGGCCIPEPPGWDVMSFPLSHSK